PCFLLLYASAVHRFRHPFPTRRSSDLTEFFGEQVFTQRLFVEARRQQITVGQQRFVEHAGVEGAVENLRELRILAQRSAELLTQDRKSTRLNSSHVKISYAVFCLKKKK